MTVLAFTTRLTGVLVVDLDPRLADGLFVRNLRITYIGLYLKLTQQSVNDDLQMKLAHTGDELSGLFPHLCRFGMLGPLQPAYARAIPIFS